MGKELWYDKFHPLLSYAYSKLCRKGESDLYYAQFDPPPGGRPPMGPPSYGPPPMGPPPNFLPSQPAWQGGHSGIRSCLFKHTYIWLDNGRGFWFYPIMVTRDVVTGFRWSTRNGWRPRTIHLNNIRSFQCF